MVKLIKSKFAPLFKKFRLRSEIESLSKFGHILAEEGLIYENSIFSRWQKGQRIPNKRLVLLLILKVFVKNGGISSIKEANQFLESADHGYLTKKEKDEILKSINLSLSISDELS